MISRNRACENTDVSINRAVFMRRITQTNPTIPFLLAKCHCCKKENTQLLLFSSMCVCCQLDCREFWLPALKKKKSQTEQTLLFVIWRRGYYLHEKHCRDQSHIESRFKKKSIVLDLFLHLASAGYKTAVIWWQVMSHRCEREVVNMFFVIHQIGNIYI